MSLITKWLEWRKNRKRQKELCEFRKHVRHILHVNDDILPRSAKDKVLDVLGESETISSESTREIDEFLTRAPLRVVRSLPGKSFPTLREYADILAVAFCVAFGIRALFLQPFKIPTSSMQPTLFGIHYVSKESGLPNLPDILHYAIYSTQPAKLVVKKGGDLNRESIHSQTRYLMFPWTRFHIAGIEYQLPGTPQKVEEYALRKRLRFDADEIVCDGWLSLGDHLFVNRVPYHFREPARGDILVFNTEGITYGPQKLVDNGYYYIKRLVGLPGDTIRIRNNIVHIRPRGGTEEKPITDFSPAFEKLYSGKGGYHGHTIVYRDPSGPGCLSSEEETYTVPDDCYFTLGDNSNASFDSRYWGVVPRRNLVGTGSFVFWPFSRRWGVVDTKPPLNIETRPGFPSMQLQ